MLPIQDLLRGSVATSTLDRPIEHLAACHRRIEKRLSTLERAGSSLDAHRDQALAAIQESLRFFSTAGVLHTEDEEQSLFPRLLPRLSESERQIVAALETEHQAAQALHAELDSLVARLQSEPLTPSVVEQFRNCVSRLSTLYQRHIALEDSTVAELSRNHLSAEQLAGISAEMKRRRQDPGADGSVDLA